jgi:hypothetical protein
VRTIRKAVAIILASLGAACHQKVPTAPSQGVVVTFRVVDETFKVMLTSEDQIQGARQAQAGGRARIPSGRIVAGTEVNRGWTWHLEDVTFAEAAIELCDGRPSDVEREGIGFGSGRYCPWAAVITSIDGPLAQFRGPRLEPFTVSASVALCGLRSVDTVGPL